MIETKQLNIGYITQRNNPKPILENLSIQLKKGKLTTLIGENGIGKSTFLKTITKIIPPISGEIFIGTHDLKKLNSQDIAKLISLVLTEKLPPSNLKVHEIVALGRQPYTDWLGNLGTEDEKMIHQAILETDIEEIKNKKHTKISDGQLQKVLIARALSQDTDIIILDEPTTHLDIFQKLKIFKLLKKIAHESDKCIVLSTHDIDLAIQLSDDMLVFTKNKVFQGEPCQLIEQNVFNHLFDDENIIFDKNFGKFIVK